MERANNFFFLEGITENAKCDFRRFDNKMLLTFCHIDDKANSDRLEVTIRTDSFIDTKKKEIILKQYFVSYNLENFQGTIKQAESLPIRASSDVFGVVVAIVNDVFSK